MSAWLRALPAPTFITSCMLLQVALFKEVQFELLISKYLFLISRQMSPVKKPDDSFEMLNRFLTYYNVIFPSQNYLLFSSTAVNEFSLQPISEGQGTWHSLDFFIHLHLHLQMNICLQNLFHYSVPYLNIHCPILIVSVDNCYGALLSSSLLTHNKLVNWNKWTVNLRVLYHTHWTL